MKKIPLMKPNQQKFQDVILQGDSRSVLDAIPAATAKMVVTSPPYFGHRKYSNHPEFSKIEIGREESLDDYIDNLVQIFAKVRSALSSDGTLWLNLGDTYRDNEMLAVPWKTALALQSSGWVLRSEVIWNKTNAMPSSVKTRPTTSHEHIFLFSKSKDYYYDADAIREPHVTFSETSKMKGGRNHFGKRGGTPEKGKFGGQSNLHTGRWDQAFHPLGRNKRTVWDIPLGKCREAHFAVFPPQLIEICIKAGSAIGDVILDPFMGAGTTALVAKSLGRRFLGIELVPEYIEIAKGRLQSEAKLIASNVPARKNTSKKSKLIDHSHPNLFSFISDSK